MKRGPLFYRKPPNLPKHDEGPMAAVPAGRSVAWSCLQWVSMKRTHCDACKGQRMDVPCVVHCCAFLEDLVAYLRGHSIDTESFGPTLCTKLRLCLVVPMRGCGRGLAVTVRLRHELRQACDSKAPLVRAGCAAGG